MDYYLIRKGNHDNPLRINLDKNEVIVGRNFFPELHESVHVSRQHASFKLSSDGEWFVTDLRSLNSVYVNGIKVTQPLHRIRLGDSIGLGVAHADTDNNFEFQLCRVNIRKESQNEVEVIALSDSETLSTSRCNQNQSSHQELVQNMASRASTSNAQTQNEPVPSTSYKQKYDDIINGKQLVVVLTRCDSKLLSQNHTLLGKPAVQRKKPAVQRKKPAVQRKKPAVQRKKPIRKRKRLLISSESSSDSEELNSFYRKSKLPCDKKTLCNVYSSDSSDEDINWFPKSNFLPKNVTSDTKHKNDRKGVVSKFTGNGLLAKAKHDSDLSNSSNSSNDEHLPSLPEFKKGISSQNKSLHFINEDNEPENISKGQVQSKPPTVIEENSINRPGCSGSHLMTNQPFVFPKVKIEKELDSDEKTVFNSTALKIKIEVPTVAIKTEVNQEEENHSPEPDFLGYSQMDEVIVISDSDDYLNFPPSQEKYAENMLNIKIEPIDGDDLDSDDSANKNKEKLYNEPNFDVQEESGVSTKNNLDLESEEEPCSENLDAIKNFLQEGLTSSQSPTSKIDLKVEADDEDNTNDFFPILSQNFYAHSQPSTSKSLQENSNKDSFSSKSDKLNIGLSTFGKSMHTTALVIEPQPMKYRPRYQRGREEWFDDGHSEKSDKGCNDQLKTKSSDTIKKQKSLKENLIQQNSKTRCTKKKKTSIKEKVKEQMGHRIRAPNGGSAIRLTSNQHKIQSNEKSSTKQIKMPSKKPISSRKNFTTKSHMKNDKNISENSIKNKSRFKSRVELLSETPVEVNKNSKKSKKVVYKIPKITSKSNCAPSLNDEMTPVQQDYKKKAGSNLINRQNSIPDNITKNRMDKKTERDKSGKLLQSESSILKLTQQASDFVKTVPTVNQNKFENEICQNNEKQKNQTCKKIEKYEKETYKKNEKHVKKTFQKDEKKINQTCKNNEKYEKETYKKKEIHEKETCSKENELINKDPQLRDPRMRGRQAILNKERNTAIVRPMYADKSNNIQTPLQSTSEKQALEKPIRLDFDSVLSIVLHWNPSWLKEYKIINKPPPCITKDLTLLPSSFKTHGEYIRKFHPFILLELWEYIFKEYNEMESVSNNRHQVNAICIMVTECISKGDIMVLNCESLVNADSAFYPREGNLLIVDLFEENNNQIFKVFGYVSNQKAEKVDLRHLHREFRRRPEAKSVNSMLYKFSLKTKKLRQKLELEKLTKAGVLCYVANKIRLTDGLQYLLTSPLKPTILQPSEKALACQSRNLKLPRNIYGNFNEVQTSAIVNIAEEMKAAYFICKMILLQGPPGTGKTHTITGLIQNLILDKNVKILVAAPSNAAVDEVGKRLIQLRKLLPDKSVRIVRIGPDKQIHRDLLPYTLNSITLHNLHRNNKSELERSTKMLTEKDEVIKQLKREMYTKSRSQTTANEISDVKNKLMMETRRRQTLIEEIDRVKRKSADICDPASYQEKLVVLEKANIILSTLGSCRSKILEKVFGERSKTHFTCCIVDEAAQCTELEFMQLLVFGLSKFTLVGDHQQLPATVHSKLAVQMNYNISLFERIHTHFQKQYLPSPILMLTKQYRMHSEICSFPSAHFYSNQLCTAPDLDKKFTSFPLKPFIILNINDSQESNIQCSKKNFPEAKIIVHICEQLQSIHDFNKYSVGIVTPYQGQKELVLRNFKGKRYYNHIEVNTIDSFQGREKDIIILSCVRARSQDGSIGFVECSKRLNVAITRARQCLIICGHMNSLQNHADWKSLIANSKKRQLYITVTSINDIPFIMEEIKRQS